MIMIIIIIVVVMKISILKIKGIKIKHGNVYIRCHPCHVTLARNKPNDHTNNATNKTENNDKANINIDSTVNDYDDSCNSSGMKISILKIKRIMIMKTLKIIAKK